MQSSNQKSEEKIFNLVVNYLKTATKNIDKWLELLDEDILIEFPYASSAGLTQKLEGKKQVKTSTEEFLSMVPGISFNNITVYPGLDPNKAFATYEVNVRVASTGKDYVQTYIADFTQANGKIVRMVEYYDPSKFQEAFN